MLRVPHPSAPDYNLTDSTYIWVELWETPPLWEIKSTCVCLCRVSVLLWNGKNGNGKKMEWKWNGNGNGMEKMVNGQ